MVIMGIDPGFAITGYGVIKKENNKFKPLDYGVITTESKDDLCKRLKILNEELEEVINYYKPSVISVEELFFSKNAKTAIKVGHGRGVALLTASKMGCDVYEYTPLQVKQAVVGYGRAEKKQVQTMVKILLNLKSIPKPDDAADALAVALCHGSSVNIKKLLNK